MNRKRHNNVRIVSVFFNSLLIFVCITLSFGIKCRTDEGPSDEELKRITRSCMRKISENGGRYSQNQSDNNSFGNYDNNWDYDDYNRDNRFRQDNRERLQMRGRSKRSGGSDRKYEMSSTNRDRNSNQNQRSSGNNNNNNNNYNNNNHGNSNNHSSYGDRRSRDMQRDQDGACVVHCFFQELNLNNDDYPDKHKITYVLTKDIRDRELRSFYTDTIQECFHYVETQRRKDKCQFSREIINCMTEYAKANCEDWQDHTLIFT